MYLKKNLLELITKFIDEYNCSWQFHKTHAVFTSTIDNCIHDLKIILNNNQVQYVYSSSDVINNEAGIYKESKNNTFTNVCKYTIENGKSQANLTKEHTISVFNNDMIEQFKYVANDYQSYYINNGQKCFVPNDFLAFHNVLNIRKQIRTREDNIIEITETKYYNDNMKSNNELHYRVAPNINNDPYVQATSHSKLDNRYIPYAGEYNSISHQTYLNYMHGLIDDTELFKDYKRIIKRFPLI